LGAHVAEARGRAENDGIRFGHLLWFRHREVGKGPPRGLGAHAFQNLIRNQLEYLVELRVYACLTDPAVTSSAILYTWPYML
jgi:hypothetical protein